MERQQVELKSIPEEKDSRACVHIEINEENEENVLFNDAHFIYGYMM